MLSDGYTGQAGNRDNPIGLGKALLLDAPCFLARLVANTVKKKSSRSTCNHA